MDPLIFLELGFNFMMNQPHLTFSQIIHYLSLMIGRSDKYIKAYADPINIFLICLMVFTAIQKHKIIAALISIWVRHRVSRGVNLIL